MTTTAHRQITDRMRQDLNRAASRHQGYYSYGTDHPYRTGPTGAGLVSRGLVAYVPGVRTTRTPRTTLAGPGFYLTSAGWAAAGVDRPADPGRATLDEALAAAYPATPNVRSRLTNTVHAPDSAHRGGVACGVLSTLNPALYATDRPVDCPACIEVTTVPATPAAATHWEFREGAEAWYTDPDGDTLRVYASDADSGSDHVIIAADEDRGSSAVHIRVAAPGPDGITPLDDVDHLIDALRAAKRAALAARAAREREEMNEERRCQGEQL